jgi:uncharacterized membrane protein YccF (DUF307 family)
MFMRTLGNVLWHFPLFGFVNAIIVYLFGLFLTLTVIAAPIGRGLMEYGKFLFAPYSRAMVKESELTKGQPMTTGRKIWKGFSTVVAIFYIPFIGFPLSLFAIMQTVLLCFTLVGIPVAIVIAKSIGVYFNPVGKKCVPIAVAQELERKKAQKYLEGKKES